MRRTIAFDRAATYLTVLFVGLVILTNFWSPLQPIRAGVGFLTIAVLPGLLFLRLVGIDVEAEISWLPYAVGTSLLLLMGLGMLLNLFLPLLGMMEPLSVQSLTAGVVTVILLMAGLLSRKQAKREFVFTVPESINDVSPLTLALLLVPIVTILGVYLLNSTGEPIPLILSLVVLAAIALVVASGALSNKHLPLAVWITALALLFHKSLWTAATYGGHTSAIRIFEAQYWEMATKTLLPNTVMMPSMARLLGIGILTQQEVVLPLLVSFLPVALYVAFGEQLGPRRGYFGVCLFMFAHPFYFQYPSVPRASMPVFFLGLLGAIMSDSRLASATRRALLGLLFAAGIAVSHYGTSYYVLFSVIGALVVVTGLNMIDTVRNRKPPTKRLAGDGGRRIQSEHRLIDLTFSRNRVLDLEFGLFYTVVVIGWYLYVGGGNRFVALTEHVIDAYRSLLLEGGGQGSTAVRLATDYGSRSIHLSKTLYLLIASLVGLGLAIAYLKRFSHRHESPVTDEFLGLSTLLFVLFGGTFLISGEWGGGRPMMIVLSFNAVFAVIAATSAGTWLVAVIQRGLSLTGSVDGLMESFDGNTVGTKALAVLLAVFLLINTGVMAALVYGGEAPSNVPNTDLDSTYIHTDIQTHVWLAEHRASTVPIYGDRRVWTQSADWINAEIAARSTRGSYRFKRSNTLDALNRTGVKTGYVVLLGHNVVEGKVVLNFIRTQPLSSYQLSLDRRHKLYTTGRSEIYAANVTTVP